jgi:hypothetical protein
MAHYPDGARCDYFGAHDLVAIGWLECGSVYRKGDLDPRFVRAAVGLASGAFQPIALTGRHRCSFCRLTGGGAFTFDGCAVDVCATNLFVPDDRRLFVAPSMLLHYMDAHEYSPPDEFQRAVLACPAMGSAEYRRAFLRAGGGALLRQEV